MPKSTREQNKEQVIKQLEEIAEYHEDEFNNNAHEVLHLIDKFGEHQGVLVHICNLTDWRGHEMRVILDTSSYLLTVNWDNQILTKYYDHLKSNKVEAYWEDQYTSQ